MISATEHDALLDAYRKDRGPAWTVIFDTLREYDLTNMVCDDGSDAPYPLVDLMSNEGESITTGENEMINLADEIHMALEDAAPPQEPTASEIRAAAKAISFGFGDRPGFEEGYLDLARSALVAAMNAK